MHEDPMDARSGKGELDLQRHFAIARERSDSEGSDLSLARSPIGFRIVRITLGLLLLAAASFKAYVLWTDPAPSLSAFAFISSPRWQLALIEAEVVLAIWLVSGLYPRIAWLAALLTFTLFAAASLYLGIAGRPSCGCFGKLEVNPWYTFGVDTLAVAALCYWRPRGNLLPVRLSGLERGSLRPTAYLAGGILLLAAGGLAIFSLLDWFSSDALAYLRGESLTVEPSVVDVGEGIRGATLDISVSVRNHSDRPIWLLGGRIGCACISTRDLPLILPPREVQTLTCKVTDRRAKN